MQRAPDLVTLDAFRVELHCSAALTEQRTDTLLDRLDVMDFRARLERAAARILARSKALGGVLARVER